MESLNESGGNNKKVENVQEDYVESKVGKKGNRLKFNKEKWVVSIINTGGVIAGGPHTKLIVEGLLENQTSIYPTLFVAEYHIIESNHLQQTKGSCPPALLNVKGKAVIQMSEYSEYGINKNRTLPLSDTEKKELIQSKLKQYEERSSSSWQIDKRDALKLIQAIKQEKADFDDKGNYKNFQYAGNMRLWSRGQGHNCLTWCMEKLASIEIKLHTMPTDLIKAIPEKHVHPMARNYDVVVEKVEDWGCKIF